MIKDFRKLFKVASKSKLKLVLTMLYAENGFVYATDAFKAIKLVSGIPEEKKGFITKLEAVIAYEKTKETKTFVEPTLIEYNDIHPAKNFDSIMPKEFIAEATVNRKYLIDLLEAMPKSISFDDITIKITANNKPVTFENDKGFGLLMPKVR